ncbi:hypothetical protein E3U43_006087 [Larimichthys crocea]|uniref:Uncharacterized protein n=1 Tax=Larimichthys crocea TaxID=215358 RepID=A0ACD3QP24_LARCR|nr:hypothetical protein E3U43_006087 [Larimichthys crocea]
MDQLRLSTAPLIEQMENHLKTIALQWRSLIILTESDSVLATSATPSDASQSTPSVTTPCQMTEIPHAVVEHTDKSPCHPKGIVTHPFSPFQGAIPSTRRSPSQRQHQPSFTIFRDHF